MGRAGLINSGGASSGEGDLKEAGETIVSLTRQGLLRVDALLPRFFPDV